MSKQRKVRKQRKTLLVVGEGQTEVAFLNYLKTIYCRDKHSVKITVQNAHGKGPENILQTAIRKKRQASYDRVIAVLDTDISWTPALKKEARSHDIALVGNTPCIEALFLNLLDRAAPSDTQDCKKAIASVLNVNLLDKSSYMDWCTKDKLEKLRLTNNDLNSLLKAYGDDSLYRSATKT